MASWEDGPEYAPVERPTGFTAPVATPLDTAPEPPGPLAGAPQVRPCAYTPAGLERPLSSYHPATGPHRDPDQPFEVARSTMTEVDSAWGLVHNYHVDGEGWPAGALGAPDPRAPILLPGATPPPVAGVIAPAAYPPDPAYPLDPGHPPDPAYPSEEQPVEFGAVFNAVTVPTFVTLLIGGLAMAVPFFGWLSPLMFILAFTTANRIAYRRDWVRNTFLVAAGALATTAVAGFLLAGNDLLTLLDLIAAVSTAICWIVLATLLAIVWQALGAGEEPDDGGSAAPRGWD